MWLITSMERSKFFFFAVIPTDGYPFEFHYHKLTWLLTCNIFLFRLSVPKTSLTSAPEYAAYGVYISQLIRSSSKACSSYVDFIDREGGYSLKSCWLIKVIRLKNGRSTFESLTVDTTICYNITILPSQFLPDLALCGCALHIPELT